ncbi:MAG: RDD family protein [Actinomycetota bacterium]|nr:RDD family protein [Actinomycetota bacterium]
MGMRYEDRMTIETPEGLTVTVPLAGVGSRFSAAAIDLAIQLTLLLCSFVVFQVFGVGGGAGGGLLALSAFMILFVYDVAFEVLAGGRTPGKRWTGLRVVLATGQPIGFVSSVIRNLLRVVDFLPSAYLVGITTILVTSRNQRLGDLAAGTVVARAPRKTVQVLGIAPSGPEPLPLALAAWDVSAISVEELATVRSFLDRRGSLERGARSHIARTMATRLRPRVGGIPESLELSDEDFLAQLARVRAARA